MNGAESIDRRTGDTDLDDARASIVGWAEALGRPDLADDAALVVSELVTNAMLHGGGGTGV